jgi:membrane-bound lytic murein transglycosylase F
LIAVLGVSIGCEDAEMPTPEFLTDETASPVMERVAARDTLIAITGYNPVSYFLYRGEPMGYEYELLQEFADHLDVELEIVVESDVDRMLEMLEQGEGDVIAYRLAVTEEREARADFTDFLHMTRQVLVQRMPDGWDELRAVQLNKALVQYPFELIDDSVHVPRNSPYAVRLNNLTEEVAGEIDIVEVASSTSVETLIKRVAEGDIDYTVAPEEVALLNQAYYGNIAARPALSLYQRIAWAVPNGADSLRSTVNTWLADVRNEPSFAALFERYFEDRLGYKERVQSEYLTSTTGRLSDYDDVLRGALEDVELDWDWLLLASQAYQESRFKPRAKSWAGAAGLMQLMPATAREVGVANVYDPNENVAGGVRYLEWLSDYWTNHIDDPEERLKFVLASYNVGIGHLQDARRLTEKYDGDPQVWDEVAEHLLQLSKRQYYQDPVVRFGYARGIEPVTYVEQILERYAHYRRFVDVPGLMAAAE